MNDLKDKFIFVCYNHGCGGEQLAVKISVLPQCNDLQYTKRGKRTVAHDVFKSGLKSVNRTRDYKPTYTGLWNVVPTHASPDDLCGDFPDSIFVLVEVPTDPEMQRKLILRTYRYFALSPCLSWQEAMGEYLDRGGKLDRIQQSDSRGLKTPIKNIDIHCLVEGIPSTRQNRKRLFLSNYVIEDIKYTHSENIIPIKFCDVYNNTIQHLLDNIQERIR